MYGRRFCGSQSWILILDPLALVIVATAPILGGWRHCTLISHSYELISFQCYSTEVIIQPSQRWCRLMLLRGQMNGLCPHALFRKASLDATIYPLKGVVGQVSYNLFLEGLWHVIGPFRTLRRKAVLTLKCNHPQKGWWVKFPPLLGGHVTCFRWNPSSAGHA